MEQALFIVIFLWKRFCVKDRNGFFMEKASLQRELIMGKASLQKELIMGKAPCKTFLYGEGSL